ncbi:uncharacterized protein LOC120009821 isoform X1 [Tripterygium wilfordii]|uniref:uncharacterized protein LOC120009821 isoform X1 n=1 Tax=Tripterygium wilfordii TaxID=458696 RepID=UPI0018F84C03|nr:uncharacterized protein LOC120009821 isoform X1 [Tripterygium wilfordii]
MEGNDQVGSSSSSFTDLFGAKEPKLSSKGTTFASMFPPPSVVLSCINSILVMDALCMVLGRKSSSSEVIGSWEKQSSVNQRWFNNQGTEGANCNIPNKGRSSIFQEERAEPCHLSSSLYYGGQDNYSHSLSNQSNQSYSYLIIKKEGG